VSWFDKNDRARQNPKLIDHGGKEPTKHPNTPSPSSTFASTTHATTTNRKPDGVSYSPSLLIFTIHISQHTHMQESLTRMMAEKDDSSRVVIHFDLDAFYVACERELNPDLRSVPTVVSQYNPYGSLDETNAKDVSRRLIVDPGSSSNNNKSADANGGLIAVSYEARAMGVCRQDRGLDAARKCPDLRIVIVPVKHGKADLTMYRCASSRVMNSLTKALETESSAFSSKEIMFEIASIDEVYVDVTGPALDLACQTLDPKEDCLKWMDIIAEASQCTTIGGVERLSDAAQAANALNKKDLRRGSRLQVLDSSLSEMDEGSASWWNRAPHEWTDIERCLACGAFLAARARSAIGKQFEGVFTLSAGIASNKSLAKLAGGLKKPNRQTLINMADDNGALEKLFHPLPLGRISGLGGKFGENVGNLLSIKTVGELSQVSMSNLVSALKGDQKTARFLFDIARGICHDEVTPRCKPKSIASGKTFRGPLAIHVKDTQKLQQWVGELCSGLVERLGEDRDQHNRNATTLVASVTVKMSDQTNSNSKQGRAPRILSGYADAVLQLVLQLVDAAKSRSQSENVSIVGLSVSATQFVDMAAGSGSIMATFQRKSTRSEEQAENNGGTIKAGPVSVHPGKKRSAMDSWLSDAARKGDGGKGYVQAAKTLDDNHSKRLKTIGNAHDSSFFSRNRGVTSSSVGVKQSPTVALPTMEEIDPEVFHELPEELQRLLVREIASQKQQKKKAAGGINNFFLPHAKP
jgi:nucleotidyltransferase/DNA polymerase involved in DNA repair